MRAGSDYSAAILCNNDAVPEHVFSFPSLSPLALPAPRVPDYGHSPTLSYHSGVRFLYLQLFLSTRRVRLLEDLLLLTASLGDDGEDGGAEATTSPHQARAGPLSSVTDYKRELARALQQTNTASAAAASRPPPAPAGALLSSDACDAAQALQAAARVSTEAFFGEWAERFGTLLVPLGGGSEGGEEGQKGGGGGEGGGRKDDR